MKKFSVAIALVLAVFTTSVIAGEKYIVKGPDNYITVNGNDFVTVLEGKVSLRCSKIGSEPGVDNIGKEFTADVFNCTKGRKSLEFISMVKKGVDEQGNPYRGVYLFRNKQLVNSSIYAKMGKDWVFIGESQTL